MERISRPEVVQQVLDLYKRPSYLEIGVNAGETFHQVQARHKVAVDPLFVFDVDEARKANSNAVYHEIPSDEYFGTIIAPDTKFDVIYLDGLHTFEQTLRDLINALDHLTPNGVIVIDDVRPPSYLASLPDRENYFKVRTVTKVTDKSWMGDVYRLIWFIDTFFQNLSYRTIANNHGQAVVWRQRRESVTERRAVDVSALTFEEMILQLDTLRELPFSEIIEEVRAAVR